MLKLGSLFSGAGGLDLAVGSVFGAETVWHCELDSAASKVLAHRWPGVPNLGSITEVDWAAVEPVDVLCGGFPCQDVSSAGKRAGLQTGTRSGLWAMYAEAIEALRPAYVVIENVRGLLSATAHRPMESEPDALGDRDSQPVLRAIGAVLGDLSDLGYDARWATVSAASVGAPHRRERVFILATDAERIGWQRAAVDPPQGQSDTAGGNLRIQPDRCGETFDRRSDGQRRPLTNPQGDGRHEGWPEPARLVGGSDAAERGNGAVELLPTPNAQDGNGGGRYNSAGHQSTLPGEVRLLPTPKASDGQRQDCPSERERHTPSLVAVDHYLPTPAASAVTGGGQHPSRREGHTRQLCDYVLLCTPAASDGEGGKTSRSGSRIDEPLLGGQAREMAQSWGKYAPAIARWEAVTRPAPSPTEPNKNGNPRLSAAFSEWLMGWPAGWVTDVPGISRNDQLRIVGNGVVPQCAAAALRYLLSLDEVAA